MCRVCLRSWLSFLCVLLYFNCARCHVTFHVRSVFQTWTWYFSTFVTASTQNHQVWTYLKRHSFQDCCPFDICCGCWGKRKSDDGVSFSETGEIHIWTCKCGSYFAYPPILFFFIELEWPNSGCVVYINLGLLERVQNSSTGYDEALIWCGPDAPRIAKCWKDANLAA